MPKDQANSFWDLCADQEWRIRNLYSVRDEAGRVRPFTPNDAQEQFLKDAHKRNIILKARQLGFTTLVALLYLDDAIWTPNLSALIVAHRNDDAKKIFAEKIKWTWERFKADWPEIVAELGISTPGDSASELKFSHGSSVRVSTSGRSGTYQRVLITEFGKTCARDPMRADEIMSGTLNAAHKNAVVTIESTAEGQDGHFFRMTQEAKAITPGMRWPDGEADLLDSDAPEYAPRKLNAFDYKFHFYPWWSDKRYVMPAGQVRVPDYLTEYFEKTEALLGIQFTPSQRAWYAAKEREQGGTMTREFPSHPAEAFESALEGCYLENEIVAAKRRGRIADFALLSGVPVNTAWDLGHADATAIWLHQRDGDRHRLVGYYENSGEHISHYIRWLNSWAEDNNAVLGEHYAPHDADRGDVFLEHGRQETARRAGVNFRIVPRISVKQDGIEAVRGAFASCVFDERRCALGLKRLRHYRKEWDDRRQVYRDRPLHDENSHGYDAFETLIRGYRPPAPRRARRNRETVGGML